MEIEIQATLPFNIYISSGQTEFVFKITSALIGFQNNFRGKKSLKIPKG
jgi:hypothetical protein